MPRPLRPPVAAQEDTALTAPASLHKDPDGVPLVSLPAGAPVEAGRSPWRLERGHGRGVDLHHSTERTRRDGFDLVVTTDEGENLRRSPNGPVVGRVREGTLLERVGAEGEVDPGPPERVDSASRRFAPSSRASSPRPPSSPRRRAPRRPRPPPPQPGPPAPRPWPGEPAGGPDRVQTARETPLGAAPEGGTLGTLQAGTPARVVARSGDW